MKHEDDRVGPIVITDFQGLSATEAVPTDVLQRLFGQHGSILKISTFEKPPRGYQALIQFADSLTAMQAKCALSGVQIPRSLVPHRIGGVEIDMRVDFSGLKDLTVKKQTHRARDFTNPSLPTEPGVSITPLSAGEGIKGPVLVVAVEAQQYPIKLDAALQIFTNYGLVKRIAVFDRMFPLVPESALPGGNPSAILVQFGDAKTAETAKSCLEGYAMYAGDVNVLRPRYSYNDEFNPVRNSRFYASLDILGPSRRLLEWGRPANAEWDKPLEARQKAAGMDVEFNEEDEQRLYHPQGRGAPDSAAALLDPAGKRTAAPEPVVPFSLADYESAHVEAARMVTEAQARGIDLGFRGSVESVIKDLNAENERRNAFYGGGGPGAPGAAPPPPPRGMGPPPPPRGLGVPAPFPPPPPMGLTGMGVPGDGGFAPRPPPPRK